MDRSGISIPAPANGWAGSCVVVALVGQAGIEDCAWFRQLLKLHAAQRPRYIVADLSRLSSIDWWATLLLLWVGREVRRSGGALALASPQPAVAQSLDAAGAAQVVAMYESVQQATGGQMAGAVSTTMPMACVTSGHVTGQARNR